MTASHYNFVKRNCFSRIFFNDKKESHLAIRIYFYYIYILPFNHNIINKSSKIFEIWCLSIFPEDAPSFQGVISGTIVILPLLRQEALYRFQNLNRFYYHCFTQDQNESFYMAAMKLCSFIIILFVLTKETLDKIQIRIL